MVQNLAMRLDHISYVTSHNNLADTVQRLGGRLETTFVDGGIHPRFGTRNFTSPLKNGQYIEIVCPLEHPATEQTPWGKAVSKKAAEGGGWFTWVFSTKDLKPIVSKFGRPATEGHRVRPSGSDLKWKQIGVKEIAENRVFPFFIEWLSTEHPSQDGKPVAEITKIVISDLEQLSNSWFEKDILNSLGDIHIEWVDPANFDNQKGIISVELLAPSGLVTID